jgi:hypothetical protein
MISRSARVALSCLALFGLFQSGQAFAQSDRPLQVAAGYQFLHESVDRGGQSFPVGAYVGIERTVTGDRVKAWSWMGQFEAGFHSDSGITDQLYTILGGIRVASSKPSRWTPSGFGLLGLANANASCEEFCAGSKSGVAAQGGFAMTTRMTPATLVDITFKATKLRIDGSGVFNVAVAGGVRFNIGGR